MLAASEDRYQHIMLCLPFHQVTQGLTTASKQPYMSRPRKTVMTNPQIGYSAGNTSRTVTLGASVIKAENCRRSPRAPQPRLLMFLGQM